MRFNEKFAVRAARTENLHRPVAVKADRLRDILCHREQRHVGQQLTLLIDGEHDRLVRRVHIEPHDIADFSTKNGSGQVWNR